jgi:hypothetical protein
LQLDEDIAAASEIYSPNEIIRLNEAETKAVSVFLCVTFLGDAYANCIVLSHSTSLRAEGVFTESRKSFSNLFTIFKLFESFMVLISVKPQMAEEKDELSLTSQTLMS